MQNSGNSSWAGPSPTPPPIATRPSRFALNGHSIVVDRRVDAVRRDLAHIDFAGRVFVPSYATPIRRAVVARGDVRADVRADSDILSEILPGEAFDVLEVAEHRAWGQSPIDGCVGYVDLALLGDMTSAPLADLPRPLTGQSIANAARVHVGTPARVGGRSASGMDAGGFLFATLRDAGFAAPRFADLQRRLGTLVEEAPRAGDLVVMAEGIAVIFDDATLIIHDSTNGVVAADRASTLASHAVEAVRRLA